MEPGHLINLDYSRASAYSLAVGASWGRLDIFFLSIISLFFLPVLGRRPDIN